MDIENREKKTHLKKFLYILILLLIVCCAVAVYVYAQKPAQGVVKVSPQEQAKLVAPVNDAPEAFTGKYISFLYGNSYVMKTHDVFTDDSAVILEQAYMSETVAVSKKIALTIRSLPSHNLDDCPDFRMRAMKTNVYKKENFVFENNKGISFEVIDGGTFEKTFFLLHGDYLAIITIASPSFGDEKLQTEVMEVVRSIYWLK